MNELNIIVEGQTEEEFVNNSLRPYLKNAGVTNVKPVLLETSPGHFGGDMSFARYKMNVDNLLQGKADLLVTSLIDFFQLRNDFPGYTYAIGLADKIAASQHIENEAAKVIANPNFVPYIQLHEFEGLLFSDEKGFDYIPNITGVNRQTIKNIIAAYPNPELINDGATTAPSKRLMGLIPKYKKTFHGPIIALENGMTPIIAKCPRFKNWITTIIAKMTAP